MVLPPLVLVGTELMGGMSTNHFVVCTCLVWGAVVSTLLGLWAWWLERGGVLCWWCGFGTLLGPEPTGLLLVMVLPCCGVGLLLVVVLVVLVVLLMIRSMWVFACVWLGVGWGCCLGTA